MTAASFVIQNKVFSHSGELVRYAQMKSFRRASDVTRYIRREIQPIRPTDLSENYRIAVTVRRGDGEKQTRYVGIAEWMESRN